MKTENQQFVVKENIKKQAADKQIFNYRPIKLPLPDEKAACATIVPECRQSISYNLAEDDNEINQTIYYISDLHLEHQLNLNGKSLKEIGELIRKKVLELIGSFRGIKGIILFAGDIADSIELEKIFFDTFSRELLRRFGIGNWKMISVLGNHEIWNVEGGQCRRCPVDKIIANYFQSIHSTYFLENGLYLDYKKDQIIRMDESEILAADINDLAKQIRQSSLIVLGGNGFSGLNPKFNASCGLYQGNVTPKQDVNRSMRFRAVYEKVMLCAKEQQVIVLTHTPKDNWTTEDYNPKWVYISGHTHQNTLLRRNDGTTVLSDNQIGYVPRSWSFNNFVVCGRYDPFINFNDGIYQISVQDYMDFNRGHSIDMEDFKRTGEIYMAKKCKLYMFFFVMNKKLYILEGGRLHKAERKLKYYYDNMLHYKKQIKKFFLPYYTILKRVSSEVKAFGGVGIIHGCIIDIDFCSHLYVNPFDGSVTPYWGKDMTDKFVYKNVVSLLTESPIPALSYNGTPMIEHYKNALENKSIPLLGALAGNESLTLATSPELVLDRTMYEPSRIMRSIQYIFEQGVIRIWNDDFLYEDFDDGPPKFDDIFPDRIL